MGSAASPSVLTTVNRVLLESGLPEVTVLTSRHAKVALEALNDAVHDIWSRQRWNFARGAASIKLVTSQRDYALPSRFDRMAQPFRTNSTYGYIPLQELSPERWWETSKGTSTADGSPAYYTIKELVVSFYPTPSADYITNIPSLEYEYYQSTPPRRLTTEGSSSWDVPLDFADAMNKYGKARLKEYLEYPDGTLNLQQYEQALRFLLGKFRAVRTLPTLQPPNAVVSEW